MGKDRLSPSMMCVDFARLEETLRVFEAQGVEFLHIDIMDGCFVQNFALGVDFCDELRAMTRIPLDLHLMVEEPERKLAWFHPQEGELVSVHVESTRHLQRALSVIRAAGAMPLAAVNPGTPLSDLEYVADDLAGILLMTVNPGFAGQKLVPQTLRKIRDARAWLDAHGRPDACVEVDGNVSFENALRMKAAGADTFVCGSSSVFSASASLPENLVRFRASLAQPGEVQPA